METAASAIPLRAGRARVWPVLAVVVVVYAVLVSVVVARRDVRWFVHLGARSLHASTTSRVITPRLGAQSRVGYDGQYYYFLAVDPVHAKDYVQGRAGYVYARPLYPALARAASLGSAGGAAYAMLAINLVAVGAGTLAVALWLRRRRSSPWYALLYGFFPGLVYSVFRDLTEPLAFGLVAAAVLVFDPRSTRRLWAAAALFALAALTRETVLLFALGAACRLLLAERRWRRPLAFLGVACLPLAAWRLAVAAYVDAPVQERGDGVRGLLPFHGLASWWPWDGEHALIAGAVALPTLAAAAGACLLVTRRVAIVDAALLFANAAAFVVFLPAPVDVDYGGAGRAALGVVLATIYCLPRWRDERPRFPSLLTATLWSPAWFVLVAAAVGVRGLALITS